MAEFKITDPNKYTNSDILLKETGALLFRREEDWFISGVDSLKEGLTLIANHNPTPPKELTVAEKLASVGLNLDDLKSALGL